MGKLLSALVILALLSVLAMAAEQRPVKPSQGTQQPAGTLPDLSRPRPGDTFRDCPRCPEMVVLPAGRFKMGSLPDEPGREDNEGPEHVVTILAPLAVGRYEVTFAEWDACLADRGCGGHVPGDHDWGRGDRPVQVNWKRAQGYIRWLSRKTGLRYRLLSESEWEYAARARVGQLNSPGTLYGWGNAIGKNNANCDGCGSMWDDRETAPVGSFNPSRFGIYDMHGNVWEWVEDCWGNDYFGASSTGAVRNSGCSAPPDTKVLRGGAYFNAPGHLRSANREGALINASAGFRVARPL